MTVRIALELIGENYRQVERSLAQMFGPLFYIPRRVSYVARVDGADPMDRNTWHFLRGQRDYSLSNRKGSRGIRSWYTLTPGHVYVRQKQVSWNTWKHEFITAENEAIQLISTYEEVEEMGAEARIQWLAAARAHLLPASPAQ